MCGITLSTYSAWCKSRGYPKPSKSDLRDIPFAHWLALFRELFWDKCRASDFLTPSIRWIIVDWVWASGPKVIRLVQNILGVSADGIVGPRTLKALNDAPQESLFDDIFRARVDYIDQCCRRAPKNEVFRRGWLRRLNAISFLSLNLNA